MTRRKQNKMLSFSTKVHSYLSELAKTSNASRTVESLIKKSKGFKEYIKEKNEKNKC